MNLAHRQGALAWELRAAMILARVLRQGGDAGQTFAVLAPVYERFSEGTRGQSGLADVNPIFTWVRLAQRVPVRIDLDHVPDGVRLVAGQTANVQIVPGPGGPETE
jgi:multidrug resistance efflux pump